MKIDFLNIDTDDPTPEPNKVTPIKRYQRRIVQAVWLCQDWARLEQLGKVLGIERREG